MYIIIKCLDWNNVAILEIRVFVFQEDRIAPLAALKQIQINVEGSDPENIHNDRNRIQCFNKYIFYLLYKLSVDY